MECNSKLWLLGSGTNFLHSFPHGETKHTVSLVKIEGLDWPLKADRPFPISSSDIEVSKSIIWNLNSVKLKSIFLGLLPKVRREKQQRFNTQFKLNSPVPLYNLLANCRTYYDYVSSLFCTEFTKKILNNFSLMAPRKLFSRVFQADKNFCFVFLNSSFSAKMFSYITQPRQKRRETPSQSDYDPMLWNGVWNNGRLKLWTKMD